MEAAVAEEAAAILAFSLEAAAALRVVGACRLLRWEAVLFALLTFLCRHQHALHSTSPSILRHKGVCSVLQSAHVCPPNPESLSIPA